MGTHGYSFTYYLLILISDDEKTPEHEVANKIEDHCRYLGLVFVLAHKTASAREGRSKGKLFWNNTLEETQCFYTKPGFEIGEYKKVEDRERIQLVTRSWERWGTQARGFQLGAETYLGDENYSLAAFMVHQAIESTFIAAINMELGYRLSSHNLSRMLKLTLLFTENFRDVFELNTNEGIAAFEALQTFYSNSRYKEDFNPDEDTVELILPKVELLLEKAEDVFKGFTYIRAAK
jgi:HEPN domain-containing protein